ncbi:hypothetical protein T492DRAFT_973078 [Pavlovales sp. CCMP2436]|nr:hypothetical protein T492DRAFT_973078 [Pavlovales sp. CCMP2436]
MAAHSPRALRHPARSTERRVRVFNFGAKLTLVRADTSPPSDVLHLSSMSRKKSHVGRNSNGSLERRPRDGLNGAASPFKARGARPSQGRRREPYRAPRAPRVPRVPRETLDRSSGVPGGEGGGSCSARRTSKVGIGKMDERQAQVCAHTQGEHDSA